MENLVGSISGAVMQWVGVAVLILAVVTALVWSIRSIANLWTKVSPNEVAVVSGGKYKIKVGDQVEERGYKVVTGGGFLLIPFLEKVQTLSLNLMTFDVDVSEVPDFNGALVTVRASANVKIISDVATLPLAVERFLGKDTREILETAKRNMEGNLRAIVGTMTIDELIKNRQKFQEEVLKGADSDLRRIGLGIDLLTVKEVTDSRGYIDALGKKQTAEVVRDATIGEAEAHRDAQKRSAVARQEGAVADAQAAEQISAAERQRDTAIAQNNALVKAAEARIPIAAQVAAAEETKRLNIANTEAEAARIEAETALQLKEKERHDAELRATVVVAAERKKEAAVIEAEGQALAAERIGEARRIEQEKEGKGTQARQTAEAEGRKALAFAHQAEKEAEAAGERAKLLAEAAGTQAQKEAEAAGERAMADAIRAKLVAEAEGILKKAEAFKQLDEAGRFLLILEALPPVIEAIGEAASKVTTPLGQAIGQGLGNIDEIRIIDMGGNGADGKNIFGQFASMPTETIYGIVEKLRSTPLWPIVQDFAGKAGVDLSQLGSSRKEGVTKTEVVTAP